MNNTKAFGAKLSPVEKGTMVHFSVNAAPLTKGGIIYAPADSDDQFTVGICTGIDLANMASKVYGKKYSPDFHYFMQKVHYDGDMTEGSSNLSSLKVGQNIGFLPIELFPYITEADRQLPYAEYIAKMQAIPSAEIAQCVAQCENKLLGYASVNPDIQSMAQAILDSQAGIMCMYEVDDAWWTSVAGIASYAPADIDPIRAPKTVMDGHSIKPTYFDFSASPWLLHANTWGTTYDLEGNCHVGYLPEEVFIPYFNMGGKFVFNNDLSYGMNSIDVKQLQERLGMPSSLCTGYFGLITEGYVVKYQMENGITPVLASVQAPMREKLNS